MIKKREDIVLLFLTRAKRLFFFLPHQEMKEAERGFDRGCPGLLHLRLGSTTGNSANKAPARDAQGSDWQAFKGIPQPECNVSQCSLWPKLSSGRISAKIKGDDDDDDDDPVEGRQPGLLIQQLSLLQSLAGVFSFRLSTPSSKKKIF